jgi:DNA-binding NarL/FixJ family response regulator
MHSDLPRPVRIIIADDHPLFRSAVHSVLSGQTDFEVLAEAADGQEALELCRRLEPDLVLMDLSMPKKNGLEATLAIKRELPRTIVLIMTASEDPDRLAEALLVGTAGYVLKTATPQQIITAVRRVVNGESPLNQEVAMGLLTRLLENEHKRRRSATSPTSEAPSKERPELSLARALSRQEMAVLRLIAQGYTNQQIAEELLLSTSTVKKHVHRVLNKLEVSDRTQAAILAIKLDLLSDAH